MTGLPAELVAAGGGMLNVALDGVIGRVAAVVAPGLMVMAMILFMGKVSGAHFNPAVSIRFALGGLPIKARARLRGRHTGHCQGPPLP